MTDDAPPSALADLLKNVERELHLRRRDIFGRLDPVETALAAYRRALEEESAREYAASHGLKRSTGSGVSPQRAAKNLLSVVLELPELEGVASLAAVAPDDAKENEAAGAPFPSRQPGESSGADREVLPLESALPRVAEACDSKKLIIAGALSGRRRALPEPLGLATEWLDTGDGGAHAIGNVPTRIRQGRIFGLIICDQAISHKHSEPLVAAARAANVPIGFAGKGGGAGIGRALKAIEEQLGE